MALAIATLMAVYDGDQPVLLAAAIESVLNQVLTEDVESRLYIAVDGPLRPELKNEIQSRASRIYKINYLPRNCGLAAALNSLIPLLKDERFIFRMDADDISYKDRYQSQLDYFREHPQISILGTDIIELDIRNGVRRRVSFCANSEDAIAKMCRRVPVAHPTACIRRAVFDRVGGYPLSGTNEDIALWFKCAKLGFKFDNVKVPLLEFTIGDGFWRRRGLRKALSELQAYWLGILSLHGVTWKLIFPVLRFLLRVSPSWLARILYGSALR